MRKLAILTFLSLDGVMQSPGSSEEDPSGGFTQGGWAASYWGEVMEQVLAEAMATPYDLLLGRKTYDIFAAHFPGAGEDAISSKLNKATKFVATSNLSNLEWANSVPISGDIAAEISRLKHQEGPLLQVHGSWQLIQSLLSHGLIDEFRLWIFPVMIGNGKRLFGQDIVPTNLTLIRSQTTQNGVIMCIYKRMDKI